MAIVDNTQAPDVIGAPLLPVGVSHYQTAGFACSWGAYDALAERDGWQEKNHSGTLWKERELAEGRVTVYAPLPLGRNS